MRFSRFLLVVCFTLSLLASSVFAEDVNTSMVSFSVAPNSVQSVVHKGRAVRGQRSVNIVVSVTHPADKDGHPVCTIYGSSLKPVAAGMLFRALVKKPGDTEFTLWTSGKVESNQGGMYMTIYLHVGNDFYDERDGVRVPWLPGIAEYKVETQEGVVKTSSSGSVSVGIGSVAGLGPLQQAIVRGRTILVTGVFPTTPVAALFSKKVIPGVGTLLSYNTVQVVGNMIVVPDEVEGDGHPLVVCSGYPDAECSTTDDLTIPGNNAQQP